MEWILFKTLLSLVAVLGLMVAVVYVLKKYVYRGASRGTQLVPVEILGQRTLQPKRSIVVVKVLDTVFVVGMSEQGMQTIGTIDNEEAIAALARTPDEPDAPPMWMPRKHGSGSMTFAGQLQESLKGLLHRRETGDAIDPGFGNSGNGSRKPRGHR